MGLPSLIVLPMTKLEKWGKRRVTKRALSNAAKLEKLTSPGNELNGIAQRERSSKSGRRLQHPGEASVKERLVVRTTRNHERSAV